MDWNRDARSALLIAVLAFPLVMLPQVFLRGASAEATLEPAWAHLVVLTTAEWPGVEAAASAPFAELQARGVRVGPLFAASDQGAASAASLWTGRWPRSHGVRDARHALPHDAWSLAEALRASGAATAAWLEEPFVSATGIPGFERVEEAPTLDLQALRGALADFHAEHAQRRTVVWVHLDDRSSAPGVGAERLATALAALQDAVGRGQRRLDTLTVVTALRGAPAPFLDAQALVPLFVELPTRINAGTASQPHLALLDVTGFLAGMLRVPVDASVQSRRAPVQHALGGGRPVKPVEVWLAGRPVYRHGLLRVVGDAPGAAEELAQGMLSTSARPLSGAAADAGLAEARAFRAELAAQASAPREVHVPSEASETGRWSDWR